MEEKKLQIGDVQVVMKPTSMLLKALVILLIVFSMAAMGALAWVQAGLRRQTEDMRAQAIVLDRENEKLRQRMENPDDVQTITDIAREELGLVDPDTVLIELQ